MTIADLIQTGTDRFHTAGITGGRLDAEIIIADVLACDRSWLIAHSDVEPKTDDQERIQYLFDIRAQRHPMSYVLGHREFYGLRFAIDERALTPRVETETIVLEASQRAPQNARVLDVGTGSGAMAIALQHTRPDFTVTATEVSPEALTLAHENAESLLGKNHPITFIESDLFSGIAGTFDLIVANLPYVSRSFQTMPEVTHEPDVALFGGSEDGLDLYRTFFRDLPDYLSTEALVFIESDPWQQPELIELAQVAGLKPLYQDYFVLGFVRSAP